MTISLTTPKPETEAPECTEQRIICPPSFPSYFLFRLKSLASLPPPIGFLSSKHA